ncbi:MAG: hypothetical protein IJT49_08275 [Clostridia bacterium]|nr:hypothetical protein [Clostridia bacterium]
MKKITAIILSAVLVLTACLLCSCDMPIQAADSTTFRTDDRPNDIPGGEPAENIGGLLSGREITEVDISVGNQGNVIFPVFEYDNGYLGMGKPQDSTLVKTYPITVEFHGDFIMVNYYVATDTSAVQKSVLTSQDNVIIYYK